MPKTRNAARLENLRPKRRTRDKDTDSSATQEKPQARATRSIATRTKSQEETPPELPKTKRKGERPQNTVRDPVNVGQNSKRTASIAPVLAPSSPHVPSLKSRFTTLATKDHAIFVSPTVDESDSLDDPHAMDKENTPVMEQQANITLALARVDTPRLRRSQAPSTGARIATLKREGTSRRVRSKAPHIASADILSRANVANLPPKKFMGTLPTPPPRPRRKRPLQDITSRFVPPPNPIIHASSSSPPPSPSPQRLAVPALIRRPARSINPAHSLQPQPPFASSIASPKPLDTKTQERKRNRGIPSSLPPSSPPPPSSLRVLDGPSQIPARPVPESGSDDLPPSHLDPYVYDDDPDDLYLTEKENTRVPVMLDNPEDREPGSERILAPNTSSDPFGFIAVEKRLKEQRTSRYREKQPHLQPWHATGGPSAHSSTAHGHSESGQELEYVDEVLIPPPTPHKRATRDTMYPPASRSRSVSASRASTPSPSKPRRSSGVTQDDVRVIDSGSQDESFEPPESPTSPYAGKGKRKKDDDPTDDEAQPKRRRAAVRSGVKTLKGKGKARTATKVAKKGVGKEGVKRKAREKANPDTDEEQRDKWEQERQARLAYFKKLEGYVVEKEDVYVV